MTYYQSSTWIEDGWGAVERRIVVSDTYNGLFVSGIETDIIDYDGTRKEAKTSGGLIEHECQLSINDAKIKTVTQKEASEFILSAQNTANKRFIAIFIDTTTIPSSDDMLFYGVIRPEFDSEDIRWYNQPYAEETNAVKKWKFKATPYLDTVFDSFPLNDIFSKISEEWYHDNVSPRQSFFHWADKERDIKALGLVSLSKALRVLADIMQEEVELNNFGTINIKFPAVDIVGKWHPARWNRVYKKGRVIRYIRSPFYGSPLEVYKDDFVGLSLAPDNLLQTDSNAIWVSSGLFKTLEQEPVPNSGKEFLLSNAKTFSALIESVALSLACYVEFGWESNNLLIRFTTREDFVKSKIYIKTAITSTNKLSSSTTNGDTGEWGGVANYLAAEGSDIFIKDNLFDRLDPPFISSLEYEAKSQKSRKPLFTISPTLCYITSGEDDGWEMYMNAYLPHSTAMYDREGIKTKEWCYSKGVHTGIWLCVNRNDAHPGSEYEPDTYWTPAARLTVNFNGEDLEFTKISDYLNLIESNDEFYNLHERSLDIPGYYYFATDEDGSNLSWKNLKIGSVIVLDGLDYTITKIEDKGGDEQTISITCQAVEKCAYSGETNSGLTGIIKPRNDSGEVLKKTLSSVKTVKTATGLISAGQIVSRVGDSSVEISLPISSHYGRIAGVALNTAEANTDTDVLIKGIFTIPDTWDDLNPGSIVYLRDLAGGNNINTLPITNPTSLEHLWCELGKVKSNREIELNGVFDTVEFKL